MDELEQGTYGRSAGVELAAALAHAGLLVFRTEDAVRHAPPGVSPSQVSYLLKLLTDAGWLTRLKRGLYAGTGRLPGGVDVPPFVLATAIVSPSAIGLWSALAFHDLTDQVPVIVSALTPRKVVTPSMRSGGESGGRHSWHVGGIECRFFTLTEAHYRIGLQPAWADDRFQFTITDRERTVLDTFAMPRHFGGISEGLAILERSAASLDVEKLVEYVLAYGSTALVKRLGWSLEHAGVDEERLTPLLEVAAGSYSLLDPGRVRRGQHDRRWKLIVNLAAGASGE
jgi:predicted transcriptional regulator of viral defense system